MRTWAWTWIGLGVDRKAHSSRREETLAMAWALTGALQRFGILGMGPASLGVVIPILSGKKTSWLGGHCPLQANSHDLKHDSLGLHNQPALLKRPQRDQSNVLPTAASGSQAMCELKRDQSWVTFYTGAESLWLGEFET